MKKASVSVLGLALLIASCKKNENDLPQTTTDEVSTTSSVEGRRKCASQEVLEEQLRTDPERAAKLQEIERKTEAFVERGIMARAAGKLYVPVVVNIVLKDNSKVTTTQIQSQLDALNRDFNRTNAELTNTAVYLAGYPYASVANCQIEFYIQDWNADVNRRRGGLFSKTDDAVKKTASGGLDPESPSTKLNLWVCDLGGELLGYAQFPGGSAVTDGVVIHYQAFGTTASYALYPQYNKGRTATHEIGHWFNLMHIWGDAKCGNDRVDDTPSHPGPSIGCSPVNLKSICTGKPLTQWMNYMDYSDDACLYMFTAGQKTRMDAAIDAARSSYVRSAK